MAKGYGRSLGKGVCDDCGETDYRFLFNYVKDEPEHLYGECFSEAEGHIVDDSGHAEGTSWAGGPVMMPIPIPGNG